MIKTHQHEWDSQELYEVRKAPPSSDPPPPLAIKGYIVYESVYVRFLKKAKQKLETEGRLRTNRCKDAGYIRTRTKAMVCQVCEFTEIHEIICKVGKYYGVQIIQPQSLSKPHVHIISLLFSLIHLSPSANNVRAFSKIWQFPVGTYLQSPLGCLSVSSSCWSQGERSTLLKESVAQSYPRVS